MEHEAITVPDGMAKKEWFTTKEFIVGVGTSNSAFNRWLKDHPDFVQKYCQNISHGLKRVRYKILWKGVAAYVNHLAVTRPRKKISNKLLTISKAKDITTEVVNKSLELQRSQDPLLASLAAMVEMRQSQLAMGDRLDRVEQKLADTTVLLTTPVEVTDGQRKLLNDRVRNYCMQHDLPYHVIWRQIHEHVGKPAVHHYEFRHYQAALKYVEKMYNATGLDY